MLLREPGPPVRETDLAALETKYGFCFPPSYRRFLLTQNGGRPERRRFRYAEVHGPYSDSLVDWFLSVNGERHNDLEQELRAYKVDEERIPENFVPIAYDPFGNVICISVCGDDAGAVYFWDHEQEPRPGYGRPTGDNVFLIAGSFEEFLGGLT